MFGNNNLQIGTFIVYFKKKWGLIFLLVQS